MNNLDKTNTDHELGEGRDSFYSIFDLCGSEHVHAYFHQQLSPEESLCFERHLFLCDDCRDLLRTLAVAELEYDQIQTITANQGQKKRWPLVVVLPKIHEKMEKILGLWPVLEICPAAAPAMDTNLKIAPASGDCSHYEFEMDEAQFQVKRLRNEVDEYIEIQVPAEHFSLKSPTVSLMKAGRKIVEMPMEKCGFWLRADIKAPPEGWDALSINLPE